MQSKAIDIALNVMKDAMQLVEKKNSSKPEKKNLTFSLSRKSTLNILTSFCLLGNRKLVSRDEF